MRCSTCKRNTVRDAGAICGPCREHEVAEDERVQLAKARADAEEKLARMRSDVLGMNEQVCERRAQWYKASTIEGKILAATVHRSLIESAAESERADATIEALRRAFDKSERIGAMVGVCAGAFLVTICALLAAMQQLAGLHAATSAAYESALRLYGI